MRSPKIIGDVAELTPHLHKRAQKKLTARGQKEAEEIKKILEEQGDRTPRTNVSYFPTPAELVSSIYWSKCGFFLWLSSDCTSYSAFCNLQSCIHEIWVRFFGSSLEERIEAKEICIIL